MASDNLSLIIIVGTKLARPEAAAIKKLAAERKSTVSALVRTILLEWLRKPKPRKEV